MFPELRARTRQKGLCCKGFCDFMSIDAVSSQARVGGELTLLPSPTSSLIPPLTKIDRKPEGNRAKRCSRKISLLSQKARGIHYCLGEKFMPPNQNTVHRKSRQLLSHCRVKSTGPSSHLSPWPSGSSLESQVLSLPPISPPPDPRLGRALYLEGEPSLISLRSESSVVWF